MAFINYFVQYCVGIFDASAIENVEICDLNIFFFSSKKNLVMKILVVITKRITFSLIFFLNKKKLFIIKVNN